MKGLSRESRALIDAARDGDNPSANDRRRLSAALGRKLAMGAAAGAVAATASHAAAGSVAAGSGAATGAGAAATAAGTGVAGGASVAGAGALASGLGVKLVVSVAILGALGAGTASYVKHQSPTREVSASSVARATSTPAARISDPAHTGRASDTANARVESAAPSVPQGETAETPASPPPLPPAHPRTTEEQPPTVAPASDLNAELTILQEVHVALKGGDGGRALALLDEHDRRFPDGELDEESQAARVFALCAVGRVEDAHEAGRRFLRQHARSPLAARVARACESRDEGAPF